MSGVLRILLCEDSPLDAKLVAHELRRGGIGCDLRTTASVAEFASSLAEGAYDVALSDYALPDGSGLDALAAVKARSPRTPFILVSGTAGEALAVDAVLRGADDYVMKDNLARLPVAIRRALESAEARTAAAKAEAALQVMVQRLNGVLETIPDALFSVDASLGNLFYVSPGAVTVFGYAADEMIAEPQLWRRSIHADDLAAVLEAFERAVDSRAPQAVECRFRSREGDWRWLQLKVAAVSGGAEAGVRLDGVARDITDQRRAEKDLRRSEADHRSLVEHAPLGIYRATLDGRFLAVNRALAAMLGYDSAEEVLALSLPVDVYADPEERARLVERYRLEDEAKTEAQWKRRDGRLLTVRLNVRTVRRPSGEVDYFEGLVEDVTEQRNIETQFRQAQKMEAVGRLAGGVAHDFNNVLTVITTDADLLLGDLGPDDPQREVVEEIRDAALRAAGLTRQLLAFSRKQVLQPRALNLNEVVGALEKMLRRLIGEDVDLATQPASDLGTVRADPGQIEQVILNLAVNARDAMPAGGRLTIATTNVDLDEVYVRGHAEASPGRHVMLTVSDTGMGMDAQTQARIFEPFFTTKERGKGTGLGLATVYGIVKQSGGYLSVYSEPGQGTTFKIYLPRTDGPADPLEEVHRIQSAPGGHETVLLAEDDASVRKAAAEVLGKRGYRVLTAPDAQSALDLARSLPGEIHVLVTDLVMPGMSGRALSEALAAVCPGLRVLYMSGYTDDTVLRHGVLDASVQFLQKPFTADALARKVRETLDAR